MSGWLSLDRVLKDEFGHFMCRHVACTAALWGLGGLGRRTGIGEVFWRDRISIPSTGSPYKSCGPICLDKACSNPSLCYLLSDERSLLIPPYLTIFPTPPPFPPPLLTRLYSTTRVATSAADRERKLRMYRLDVSTVVLWLIFKLRTGWFVSVEVRVTLAAEEFENLSVYGRVRFTFVRMRFEQRNSAWIETESARSAAEVSSLIDVL